MEKRQAGSLYYLAKPSNYFEPSEGLEEETRNKKRPTWFPSGIPLHLFSQLGSSEGGTQLMVRANIFLHYFLFKP